MRFAPVFLLTGTFVVVVGGCSGTKNRCSGDLRKVIDPTTGAVVKECPIDQGCGEGECVAACEAPKKEKGSVGCDFRVATPSFFNGDIGSGGSRMKPPCFAIFVANNWPKDARIEVTRGGTSFDVTAFGRIAEGGSPATAWQPVPAGGIPPGKVAVLFMSSDPAARSATQSMACPITPAINGPTALPLTVGSDAGGLGVAWHLTSTFPVEAYDIIPYGGSYLPSAELLFPTTAWGTNYIAVVPPRGSAPEPQWGQIVAAEDETVVTIAATSTLRGSNDLTSINPGKNQSITLSAGQYAQWQDSGEMSGTLIESTKPISFTGGHTYACYKSASSPYGGACDSAHQQIPPLSAWGSTYAVAPFATRRTTGQPESLIYRFVGAVNGTSLAYDPPGIGGVGLLKAGEVADVEITGAFVVQSQDSAHPFYVGQTMPGAMVGEAACGGSCGDDEFVNMPPPAQYLTKYVFFTDPTYATTNLVFTRVKNAQGFQDVTLDCIGTISGWKALGAAGTHEWTTVDIIHDGVKNGACENGPHVAESVAPFGLMVWGLASYASYAYPAGANVAPINKVVVSPSP